MSKLSIDEKEKIINELKNLFETDYYNKESVAEIEGDALDVEKNTEEQLTAKTKHIDGCIHTGFKHFFEFLNQNL